MITITYVASYMHQNYFLVILDRVAHIINWEIGKGFGYICPCCMHDEHRQAIASVIRSAHVQFDGKVRWCGEAAEGQYNGPVGSDYLPLDSDIFCNGNAEVELTEAKGVIQAEAERQVTIGSIRN